jgi:hypothetical protein
MRIRNIINDEKLGEDAYNEVLNIIKKYDYNSLSILSLKDFKKFYRSFCFPMIEHRIDFKYDKSFSVNKKVYIPYGVSPSTFAINHKENDPASNTFYMFSESYWYGVYINENGNNINLYNRAILKNSVSHCGYLNFACLDFHAGNFFPIVENFRYDNVNITKHLKHPKQSILNEEITDYMLSIIPDEVFDNINDSFYKLTKDKLQFADEKSKKLCDKQIASFKDQIAKIANKYPAIALMKEDEIDDLFEKVKNQLFLKNQMFKM